MRCHDLNTIQNNPNHKLAKLDVIVLNGGINQQVIIVKFFWLILKLITASLYVFLVVFSSGFVGSNTAKAINLETLNLNYGLIAKDSAVYAICATGATLVVPPVLYVIQHYVWPVLKFIGLKIRYFFHGY